MYAVHVVAVGVELDYTEESMLRRVHSDGSGKKQLGKEGDV